MNTLREQIGTSEKVNVRKSYPFLQAAWCRSSLLVTNPSWWHHLDRCTKCPRTFLMNMFGIFVGFSNQSIWICLNGGQHRGQTSATVQYRNDKVAKTSAFECSVPWLNFGRSFVASCHNALRTMWHCSARLGLAWDRAFFVPALLCQVVLWLHRPRIPQGRL